MTLLVRAEFRKVTVMLLLSVAFLSCLTAGALAVVEQRWAYAEKLIAAEKQTSPTDESCADIGIRDPAVCTEVQAVQWAADQQFILEMRHAEENAARQQTLRGAVAFTGGLFLSALGMVVVVMLAAVLVSGEWARGTITPLLLAERRLGRILWAKTIVVWSCAYGTFLLTAGTTAALGMLIGRRTWRLNLSLISQHDLTVDAVRRLLLVGIVTLGWSAIAVHLASVLRGPVIAVLGGGFLIALMNIVAGTTGLRRWTPLSVIGDLADFRTAYGTWDHISRYAAHQAGSDLTVDDLTVRGGALIVGAALLTYLLSRLSTRMEPVT